MPYYKLPVLGHLAEPRSSVFRCRRCVACGAQHREQLADLKLRILQPFDAFSTTMDGDWIVGAGLAEAIQTVEPSVSLRPVAVKDTPGSWQQLVPTKCVEPAPCSLRAPREYCSECAGVARLRVGDYPPLVLQSEGQAIPEVAIICGTPRIVVFSDAVMEILRTAVPRFRAARVLLDGETLPPWNGTDLFGDLEIGDDSDQKPPG